MVETVFAVLIITFLFVALFRLSRLLSGKILMEHSAMRVARARAVGLNDFMCLKAGRIAMIPVAGRRLWPEGGEFDYGMELSRLGDYMGAEDESRARGLLEYEGWEDLAIDAGSLGQSRVSYDNETFGFAVDGEAGIEQNYQLYLYDEGR